MTNSSLLCLSLSYSHALSCEHKICGLGSACCVALVSLAGFDEFRSSGSEMDDKIDCFGLSRKKRVYVLTYTSVLRRAL